VISGYGFGDVAVNHQIDAWLERESANRIILLHEQPEQLRRRCMLLDGAFDRLVAQHRLVPVRKWLSDTGLGELRSHL